MAIDVDLPRLLEDKYQNNQLKEVQVVALCGGKPGVGREQRLLLIFKTLQNDSLK